MCADSESEIYESEAQAVWRVESDRVRQAIQQEACGRGEVITQRVRMALEVMQARPEVAWQVLSLCGLVSEWVYFRWNVWLEARHNFLEERSAGGGGAVPQVGRSERRWGLVGLVRYLSANDRESQGSPPRRSQTVEVYR